MRPVESQNAEIVEVSVIPCLNEAETIAACIRKAQTAAQGHSLAAEIIVADNGSTDESRSIAERLGARVVAVSGKGYGADLRGGLSRVAAYRKSAVAESQA